ncbi:MAG: peptide ABC transporter substrate-binding protein [Candidatus Spechtbacterales bacterium]
MKTRKLIALFAIFSLVAVACTNGDSGNSVSDATQPAPFSDVLRIASGEPATLDPHLVTDVGSHGFTSKLYAGLLRLDPAMYDKDGNLVAVGAAITQDMIEQFRRGELFASAVVVPDLAESMPEVTENPDGTTTYTFTIREDAKFSTGRSVTAWNVAYSLDRVADPKTRSTTAELYLGDIVGVIEMQRKQVINRISPNQDEVFVDIPGVEVLDERTIRITTKVDSVNSDVFLMKMTYPAAAVVDKIQAEGAARWTDRPNSTGPYVIVKKDVAEIIMEANPNYHGDKPKINRVIFYLAGGSTYLRYQNGELDFTGIGIADLDLLDEVRDSNSAISKQYFEATEMSTSYIGANNLVPPFDDPLVRKAFALAIDREAIAKNVFQNLVIPAHGILPPGMPGYRADYKGQKYDPDEARRLLAQSKYAGNMPRIKLTISGGGSSPSILFQRLVEAWRVELGVDVELEQIDYATFLEEMKKGSFQMFSLGWIGDYPDPDNFLMKFEGWRSAANNETQYSNPAVDALIEQARTESGLQKRIALSQQAEDIIVDEAPWFVLFHSKDSVLVKPNVCGYFPTPMGISITHNIYWCENK